MTSLTCRGMCLLQNGIKYSYIKVQPKHDCELLKCPNYVVCEAMVPLCILDSFQGTCVNCAVLFAGTLEVREITSSEEDCCVCLQSSPDITHFVRFQQCTHEVCVRCFQRISFYSEEEDSLLTKSEYDQKKRCPMCRRQKLNHWCKKEKEKKRK